jgi:GNAT superfamily N-acetyltransferase
LIFEAEKGEFGKATQIFEGLDHNLQIVATIEGKFPGRIYVDDEVTPETVLLWDTSSKFFLAGRAENDDFNGDLARLISEEISAEARERGIRGFVLHYHPDAWESRLPGILEKGSAKRYLRRHYASDKNTVRGSLEAPSDLSITRVDEGLLSNDGLNNVEKVIKEIQSMWGSREKFLVEGFGFCALHEDAVACWCLSEFNHGYRCEVGIETAEGYRNRGIGTLTASAFLEHCNRKDLTLGWHCWEDNLPSIALAERLDLKMERSYPVYEGRFEIV